MFSKPVLIESQCDRNSGRGEWADMNPGEERAVTRSRARFYSYPDNTYLQIEVKGHPAGD